MYEPLTKDEINKFLRDKKGNRILYVIKKNGGYYRAGLSTFTLDKKSLISLLKKINLNLKEEDTTNVDDEITDDIKISYDPAVIESMLEEVEISDIFDINSAEELNELNTIIVEKLSRHKNIELKEKYVKWYESLNIIRKTPKNRKVKNLVSNSLDILKQMNNGLVINLNETFNSSYPMTSIYLDMERGIITPYDPINAICYEKKEDKSTMTPIEDKEEKEEDPKKKVERKIEYSLEDKMFESITIDGENGLDLKEEYYLYYSYLIFLQ